MTSCLTSASIASMRLTSNLAALPLAQIFFAAAFGMMPSSAMAVAACASISNQMRNLVSGDQIAVIVGAGIAGDGHAASPRAIAAALRMAEILPL